MLDREQIRYALLLFSRTTPWSKCASNCREDYRICPVHAMAQSQVFTVLDQCQGSEFDHVVEFKTSTACFGFSTAAVL
jgi:hypothetical protein